MKRKTMTYLLLAAVIGIWGVIGYKLITATTGHPDPAVAPAVVLKKTQPEAYPLKRNYRNPFLKFQPQKDTVSPPASNPRPVPQEQKPVIDLKCSGRMTIQGVTYYVVQALSGYYSLKQGDSVEGLTLKKTAGDSIYFSTGKWLYGVKISNTE